MIHVKELNLAIVDQKGNAVGLWRRHPVLKKNILYALKELSLEDIERFGSDLYINNTAEKLVSKVQEQKDEK